MLGKYLNKFIQVVVALKNKKIKLKQQLNNENPENGTECLLEKNVIGSKTTKNFSCMKIVKLTGNWFKLILFNVTRAKISKNSLLVMKYLRHVLKQ